MTRPKLLADHDLNESIILGVLRREPTAEFLRARDRGLAAAPDDVLLERAAADGLVIISHDVNTIPAAARRRLDEDKLMAGLIMVHQMDPAIAAIDDIVLIWAATEPEEWVSQICFLPL